MAFAASEGFEPPTSTDQLIAGEVIPAFTNMVSNSGMLFTATAYTAGPESTGKRPGHPAYGITRSGTRVEEGRTIAVDPSVIPLGTWVYVEGFGLRRAEDTGGKIKGNRIDMYINDLREALRFGVQPLRVHILASIS